LYAVDILEDCDIFAVGIVKLKIRAIEVPGFHFPDKEHIGARKYEGTVPRHCKPRRIVTPP
jgi:hypothetical protein